MKSHSCSGFDFSFGTSANGSGSGAWSSVAAVGGAVVALAGVGTTGWLVAAPASSKGTSALPGAYLQSNLANLSTGSDSLPSVLVLVDGSFWWLPLSILLLPLHAT